ncbi:MAG: YhdH/YhfP family quinone oxidoreductase [Candidatus Dadabacteria bacterium]|nr:YhdH/YhfP family quinone oxidoreductase [Candidatus Dadabacteria bacterium]MYA49019.1 YhdH/YhfP family quinone oxidoreductase [Candidatus Dadabacteria bacterium]MYF47425.1 YhdH/YhfP family quinone oxidoreductase [Candidatus Dadabacteria bacterium]MYG82385.1 YhdH/YhfP family quinone oxidoreductase [Candidatus Dadabacteria bacterium]MYK49464.1 YhdH/YhfP family quinone oxidoreductase [Candidatus Dadabacteria bacterium]
MSSDSFKAMVVSRTEDGEFTREIATRQIDSLPDGEVLLNVKYSSLNYKDALSAIGNRGVTKNYPHTPGVDAAGVVEDSKSGEFEPGDKVIVHGYDLGMDTSGGFGQYVRVPAEWVVNLPEGLDLKESMMYGTAGFTAAQSVLRIVEGGVGPEDGKILVTGATGGVGSMAVAILGKAGYSVTASTGKPEQEQFLADLGAEEVIGREDLTDPSGRLLLKGQWAGVVDTVGGEMLATAIKSTRQRGVVTTCGNVASHELNINVYPFILRGITLVGIDSASCPMKRRRIVWEKMSGEWKLDILERMCRTVSLEDLDPEIDVILKGGQVGRVVVDLWN